MKKTESTKLEKTPITVKLKTEEGNSLKDKNPKSEPEKTREISEEAEIISPMDEILKNNDKFETIKVLMEILCKELGISIESDMNAIVMALKGVHERYYKSMEDFRNLSKIRSKDDIRQ